MGILVSILVHEVMLNNKHSRSCTMQEVELTNEGMYAVICNVSSGAELCTSSE